MSLLYLAGQYANLLKRATVTTNPAALSAYPLANLSDDDPSTPMVLGSLVANSYVQAILNALSNPNFEAALLTAWTDASGAGSSATRVSTAGHVNSGTYGCDLVGIDASDSAWIYQPINVSAGEYRQVGAYIKIITGTPAAFWYMRNRTTGKYWNGSTWTASFAGTAIANASISSGGFTFVSTNYRVEDFDTCRSDTVMMEIGIYNQADTIAIDDIQDVPGINFAAVIGHNVGAIAAAVVRYDNSGGFSGSETVASSMTMQRGAFYSTFSMAYSSPWRFSVDGTNWDEPYIGELVLGQYQTCATSPKWGFSTTRNLPAVRGRGPSARPYTYNLAVDQTRDIEMSFTPRTEAQAAEIENMVLRSGQGRWPTIIVPIDTEAGVFYGRLQEPVIRERPFMGVHEIGLKLLGDPLPVIGA